MKSNKKKNHILSNNDLEKKYPLFALGISNLASIGKKHYPLMFYDCDKELSSFIYQQIKKYFKHDLLLLKTLHGYHFISFSILNERPRRIRKRISKLSKILNQDYKFRRKNYLVLRISPKLDKNCEEISEKPFFYTLMKRPVPSDNISLSHLLLYQKHIGLPEWVFENYLNSNLIQTNLKLHIYRTRL